MLWGGKINMDFCGQLGRRGHSKYNKRRNEMSTTDRRIDSMAWELGGDMQVWG